MSKRDGTRSEVKRFITVLAIVTNLILVDAIVKELAKGYLYDRECASPIILSVIPEVFNLTFVRNYGCAWGMFQGKVWPLAIFGIVALVFLIWKRRSVFGANKMGAVAEVLLYAGIIGNLIDRIFRGYVIDMFDFHWGVHHFPCFNLADSFICISVGLLLIDSLCQSCRKQSR